MTDESPNSFYFPLCLAMIVGVVVAYILGAGIFAIGGALLGLYLVVAILNGMQKPRAKQKTARRPRRRSKRR